VIYTFPDPSVAIFQGAFIKAAVAGPPSPLLPEVAALLPAKLLMIGTP